MALLKNTRYLYLFYGQLSLEKRDKCTFSELFIRIGEIRKNGNNRGGREALEQVVKPILMVH
jgi:hypothetical protein